MISLASLNTTVTDWLSRLAAGQTEVLMRGAERFAALTSPVHELETARMAGGGCLSGTLHVVSGLHRGASMELTADEYLIGSGDDCDIVLRDSHVAARHCRLARDGSGFTIRDLRAASAAPVAPSRVTYEGGAIAAQYDVGGVEFTLRHPSPERTRLHQHPHLWVILLVVLVGVVIALVLTVAGGTVKPAPSVDARRMVALDRALGGLSLGSVHLRRNASGELQVDGIVTDAAHRRRLEKWLAANHLDETTVHVQAASDLLDEARRALADDTVRVELREGRLLVEGNTSRTMLKNRIQALAEDLHGAVAVEDRLVYVEAGERNAPGPFPVRVQGVMIANPSYFLTDSGVRYFVGGLLPDGAEVLSIDADMIRFRRAGQVIAYKLE